MSFHLKLTLAFTVTAMIEGALVGGLSYCHSRDIMVKSKKQEMSDTINRIDININVKVRYIMEVLDNAADSELARGACLLEWDKGERNVRRTYLDDYCSNLIKSISEQMEISVISRPEILYTTGDAEMGDPQDVSGGTLDIYYQAVGEQYNKAVWARITPAPFARPREERQMVTVVRAIMGNRKDGVLGMMLIELDPDMLSNLLLGNQGLLQYQYLFIVDRKEEIIYSSPKVNKGWREGIDGRLERRIRRLNLEWRGEEYYVCGQYNGVTGWKSYSTTPSEGLFPQAKGLNSIIWLAVITCTIGIAAVIAILVYAMARPIKRFSRAMSQVQGRDLTVRVPGGRGDGIGELMDSFNYMVDKISTLTHQVYQEKIMQRNAEIQALQAQINPHFLYNTLDSVNWMLIDREEYDIGDIIISLDSLMRYRIEDENIFIPLDREVEYMLSYLKIQKNHLEDRLRYQVDADGPVREEKVPKLILQPMVENAITHGTEPRRQNGVMSILIMDEGDEIRISVRDNGVGMTQKQLDHLKEEVPDLGKEGHVGIGIRNVDRRIRLHYDEQYRIRIESVYGTETSIYLGMPKETPGPEPEGGRENER